MSKYFQNELANLRELAADFARGYPTLAPQLASASNDPDVERLLEGVAFLTANIRQKIDDDFPEFSQGLLRQIFPHYLRPIPSATLVEFTPRSILKKRFDIDAGASLDSVETDGVRCRFRTCFPLRIWPLRVRDVSLGETTTGRKFIDCLLEFNGIDLGAWDEDRLRFYIGGDFLGASELNYLLHNHLQGIELQAGQGEAVDAVQARIEPVGFGDDEALLDYPGNAFPAYRLIQEYFLLKEKFLFVDICGLRQYTRGMSGASLRLRFYLEEANVRIPRMDSDRLRLFVTPAVNLFAMQAEPIRNDQSRAEYPVRPLRNNRGQYSVYSVDRVSARDRQSGETLEYIEAGVVHPALNERPVYNLIQRQSADGEHQETWIAFSYPPGYAINNRETVMLELTCSNGNLASRLRPGDLNRPAQGGSELVEFRNLLTPSECRNPGDNQAMLWRLISHLSLNYLSLANVDNLKSLLGLYIFSPNSASKADVANRKRIEGIEDVRVINGDRLVRGMPMRGQTIEVSVNAANFASRGDMYLFGQLLDCLFASFASLNSYTEFRLIDAASGETFTWPARTGDKPLL